MSYIIIGMNMAIMEIGVTSAISFLSITAVFT